MTCTQHTVVLGDTSAVDLSTPFFSTHSARIPIPLRPAFFEADAHHHHCPYRPAFAP